MHLSQQLAVTALEAARALPAGFWGKAALAALALGSVVYVARLLVRTNRVVLGVVLFVSATTLLCSWVYNRTEPRMMSPLIERLSQFFPAAPAVPGKRPG